LLIHSNIIAKIGGIFIEKYPLLPHNRIIIKKGPDMKDTGVLIKNSFAEDLAKGFMDVFGANSDNNKAMAGMLQYIAGNVFEIFYQLGDAPYHDHEHTFDVCFTGQTILKGMHVLKRVTAAQWLNYMVACLGHDIGYVYGIFSGDNALRKKALKKNPNSTGASLTPIHVNRSKKFIKQRYGHIKTLNIESIMTMIEFTRFEGPALKKNSSTNTFAGLVRAADLIGQMASPNYIKKMWHLYQEFKETGSLEKQPFDNVYDMRKFYPDFYNKVAQPLVQDAIDLLEMTMEGRTIVASLYYNLYHTSNL